MSYLTDFVKEASEHLAPVLGWRLSERLLKRTTAGSSAFPQKTESLKSPCHVRLSAYFEASRFLSRTEALAARRGGGERRSSPSCAPIVV